MLRRALEGSSRGSERLNRGRRDPERWSAGVMECRANSMNALQ